MHQVGAEDGDILLEAGQNGLADAESLDGFLISAGEQVLVMRHRPIENSAQALWQSDMHRVRPLLLAGGSGALSSSLTYGQSHVALQQESEASLPCPADMTARYLGNPAVLV